MKLEMSESHSGAKTIRARLYRDRSQELRETARKMRWEADRQDPIRSELYTWAGGMEPEPVAGSSRGFPTITQFLVVNTRFFRACCPCLPLPAWGGRPIPPAPS